jgi:hypothetical protein
MKKLILLVKRKSGLFFAAEAGSSATRIFPGNRKPPIVSVSAQSTMREEQIHD